MAASANRDVQSCTVILHNASARGVVAYVVEDGGDSREGVASSRESFNFRGQPVIPPNGESQKLNFSFGHSGRMTPRGFMESPAQPQQVIVAAAIFSDGSYEGDHAVAVRLKSQQMGNLTVYRLMTPVIDRIVQDKSMKDDARTARIKDEIFRIPTQPDQPTLRAVQSQFPDLPTDVLIKDLTQGLDSARNNIWGDLYSYMHNCCQYPPPDHISLSEWWKHTRHSIEPILAPPS
jgi:hypothetical protein